MRLRIRTIKPELFSDERVGDLSHGARLLFIGLITMADDEGRLRELPTAINGHVFPYDEVSPGRLGRWLGEIERSGMVVRYQADGKRYIAFRHWSRHQRVDRPNPSELPAPNSTNDTRNSREAFDESIDESGSGCSIPPRRRASGPVLSLPVVAVQNNRNDKGSEDQAEWALFAYWRERCQHASAKFSADRRAKLRARRREGYTDEQIRSAIDGAARAAHVNDAGRRFDDLELICRTGSKLESFIARASGPIIFKARGRQSASDLLRKISDAEEAS